MPANATSLGWLGTGRMGAAMAGRLIDAGEQITVGNRTPAKPAPLAARGAAVAGTISDLASCDIVFVMVARPDDLEQVVCGEAGLLSADRRPAVIVDCSTVSAPVSASVRAAPSQAGRGFLPAPGSRDPPGRPAGGGRRLRSG